MHFPQQDPPWYFGARSISNNKRGNICVESGNDIFFLKEKGRINKILYIKDENGMFFGIHFTSIDEKGYIYVLALAYKSYQIIKADPMGRIINRGEIELLDIMYSNVYIWNRCKQCNRNEKMYNCLG